MGFWDNTEMEEEDGDEIYEVSADNITEVFKGKNKKEEPFDFKKLTEAASDVKAPDANGVTAPTISSKAEAKNDAAKKPSRTRKKRTGIKSDVITSDTDRLIIPEGMSLKAQDTLITNTPCLIEGSFEGTLKAKSITVTSERLRCLMLVADTITLDKGSNTVTELKANDVTVLGAYKGDIEVKGVVTVGCDAVIDGSIKASRIDMDDNAIVTGTVTLIKDNSKGIPEGMFD